ncbi:MAG: hypothetical protein ACJ76Z_04630 [Thermoleophilaceae bacterium]
MIRRRLTFANVISFVALFVALSAGSYAAITLPANSVGSKQLKAKAVIGKKIAANAVDSSKVKNGSLTGADINLSALGKVPSAAAADSAAIARVKTVTAGGTSRPAGGGAAIDSATATCDSGLVVVGGGVSLGDQENQITQDSYPSAPGSWTAHVLNGGGGTPGFTVYAICAPAASTQ